MWGAGSNIVSGESEATAVICHAEFCGAESLNTRMVHPLCRRIAAFSNRTVTPM
jgi:hypothetical protein